MIKERKWMNLKYNVVQLEWNKLKEWKYQGDVRERMKGPKGGQVGYALPPVIHSMGTESRRDWSKNGSPGSVFISNPYTGLDYKKT